MTNGDIKSGGRSNRDNQFRPSKAMGQNFLIDPNIPQKIVRCSGIDKSCGVLEAGPGLGALTAHLAESAGHVAAVELDARLYCALSEMFSKCPNVVLVHGDILKIDLQKLVEQALPEPRRHVCANLPYNITTPLITKFLKADIFESITVMVQKEVALRICAKPGTSEYGAFTVFVNYHAHPEILFDISPDCFKPRPKVTSCVVKMTTRPERRLCDDDEKRFFRTVRAAFGQRRKTLVNALHAGLGSTHSKEDVAKAVQSCGFDANIRGEALSISEFIELSERL